MYFRNLSIFCARSFLVTSFCSISFVINALLFFNDTIFSVPSVTVFLSLLTITSHCLVLFLYILPWTEFVDKNAVNKRSSCYVPWMINPRMCNKTFLELPCITKDIKNTSDWPLEYWIFLKAWNTIN